MKSEIEFKKELRKAFEDVGAAVSCIEPGAGATPGVLDLAVAWGRRDLWIELKVTDRFCDSVFTWEQLLRASQRQWIRNRSRALFLHDKAVPPVYVVVLQQNELQTEIQIYRYDQIREILVGVKKTKKVSKVVEYFSGVCEVLHCDWICV